MKPQRRYIKLTYVATGESVLAEMLDDEAPAVCREVWEMLPLEDVVIHGQYSGAEVFVRLRAPRPLPNENLAQIPLPGEIYYFFDIGSNVTSGGKPGAEICLVYSRGVTFRGPEGSPTTASLFARIPGDWKYDWVDFAIASRRARFEGPHKLRIERAES